MNLLLVAFSCGSSWSTTACLIESICVPVFEVFYPLLDTAGAHAGTHE